MEDEWIDVIAGRSHEAGVLLHSIPLSIVLRLFRIMSSLITRPHSHVFPSIRSFS